MSSQDNANIYLAIEAKINDILTGDSVKNALDFIAFAREGGISFEPNEEGNGWAVGGTVGDSIGYMIISNDVQMPAPWVIWFNSCDFDCGDAVDDKIKETAWSHASQCGHCHEGWKDCGGGDRMIFGKEFEMLCHSPLMFTEPDAETLAHMIELIGLLKH